MGRTEERFLRFLRESERREKRRTRQCAEKSAEPQVLQKPRLTDSDERNQATLPSPLVSLKEA